MGTVVQYLTPEEASFFGPAGFPEFRATPGANFTVTGLAYDGAGSLPEEAAWKFTPVNYGSGDMTVDVIWYAESGTSGAVKWWAAVAAITPDVDTQNVETKFYASPVSTVVDNHLGTVGKRLHKATITIAAANLNSMAAGDECWIRLFREPADAEDTIDADVIVTSVRVSYSDT